MSILQKRIVSQLFQMSVFCVTRKIINLSTKANTKPGQVNPYFSWIHFKLTLSPSYFALKTTLQITLKSKHNGYCLHMVSNINPRTGLPTVSIKQGYFLQIRRNWEPHLKPVTIVLRMLRVWQAMKLTSNKTVGWDTQSWCETRTSSAYSSIPASRCQDDGHLKRQAQTRTAPTTSSWRAPAASTSMPAQV